jgi:NhaA family Na+:H+ antiporter
MMGRRVPLSLKVFLAALAIMDDLGAVLVIALFYTSEISLVSLGMGCLFLAVLIGANLAGVRHALFYALVGIGGVWLAFLLSGIHPTIAGVLAAWTIPARPHLGSKEFVAVSRRLLGEFQRKVSHKRSPVANQERHKVTLELEQAIKETDTPLQRLEHGLNPWLTGIVLPVFALANAGVTFEGNMLDQMSSPVTIGILLGLLLGKPLGVAGAAWLARPDRSGRVALGHDLASHDGSGMAGRNRIHDVAVYRRAGLRRRISPHHGENRRLTWLHDGRPRRLVDPPHLPGDCFLT